MPVFGFIIQRKARICSYEIIEKFDYSYRRERNTSIHPDNRQDVQLFRERAQQNSPNNATHEIPPAHVGRPRHDTCPICLSDSSVLSVETNCGHLFCGL